MPALAPPPTLRRVPVVAPVGASGLSPAREAFAHAVAEGWSAAAAYSEFVSPGASPGSANSAGPALARLPLVADRIRQLVTDAAVSAAAKRQLTRDECQEFLAAVVRTPAGEVGPGSQLAQEVEQTRFGLRVKMPGKLDAINTAAKLNGWLAPDKSLVAVGVLHPDVDTALAGLFGHGPASDGHALPDSSPVDAFEPGSEGSDTAPTPPDAPELKEMGLAGLPPAPPDADFCPPPVLSDYLPPPPLP